MAPECARKTIFSMPSDSSSSQPPLSLQLQGCLSGTAADCLGDDGSSLAHDGYGEEHACGLSAKTLLQH